MRKIAVKISDYLRYTNSHNTNKLDDNFELYGIGSFPPKFLKIEEEIFNGTKTDYHVLKKTNDYILLEFISKRKFKYRIDLLREPDTKIWHIGFSMFDNPLDDINYEILTDNKESIDVLSRIIWIIRDIKMDVEYCIGMTGDIKKDRIYEYMMRLVSNWDKRATDNYPTGWGIFFRL